MDYPDTYYAAEIGHIPQKPSLSQKVTCDVCVVGAGLAGLTTALELLRKGKTVVVLESHRVGWGASGRNGGAVVDGFAEGGENIAKKVGQKNADILHQLSRDGLNYVRDQIEILKIEGTLEGSGIYSAVRHSKTEEAQSYADTAKDQGVVFYDHTETRKIMDSAKYNHSLYIPDSFHIQPLRYVLGLATEIERLAGQIFEASKAVSLEKAGDQWCIRTKGGEVCADNVVLCTSAYDFDLMPKVSRAMLPIATYAMATEPMSDALDGAIKTTSFIADTRRAGDYYRRLPNGRLLWGGRITTRKSKPAKLAEMLSKDVTSVYPQLKDLKLTHAWEGRLGYAIHKMPLIGRVDDGLWVATAFGGQGLNTTAMAGSLIASAIADQDETYELFEAFTPRWAGGVLGRIGVQLTYWYIGEVLSRNASRSRLELFISYLEERPKAKLT